MIAFLTWDREDSRETRAEYQHADKMTALSEATEASPREVEYDQAEPPGEARKASIDN
jgi:hypothetical protein